MEEDYLKLKTKIEATEKRLKKDKEKLQQICPHEHIKHNEGYTEYQGYDRDYIPGSIKCLNCGLYAHEDDKKNYTYLRECDKRNKGYRYDEELINNFSLI